MMASPPTPRAPSMQVSMPTMASPPTPSPPSTRASTLMTVSPPIPLAPSTPGPTPTMASLPIQSTRSTTLTEARKSDLDPHFDSNNRHVPANRSNLSNLFQSEINLS